MDNYVINATRIVTPEEVIRNGSIVIENGTIKKVSKTQSSKIPHGFKLIENNGPVLPGVIDDQVHFRDGTASEKATIASESRAAVAGGVTSVIHNPNNANDPIVTVAGHDEILEVAQRDSRVNFGSNILSNETNLDELKKIDPRRVAGIKSFLGKSTGGILTPFELMPDIFRVARDINEDLIVITHSEDPEPIKGHEDLIRWAYEGREIPHSVNPVVRNAMTCLESTKKILDARDATDGNLHIYHLTTMVEADMLANRYAGHPKVSTEVCAHYLLFDETDYDRLGSKLKCFPAVKSPNDRKRLLEAVINGDIKIIATDHAPHTAQEKEGDYFNAPGGVPLVQHSLVAMLDLFTQMKGIGRDEDNVLRMIANRMSLGPAERFKIKDRGAIREGYKADLACVYMANPWKVTSENIFYLCGFSPFEEHAFNARVGRTFVNGQLAYDHGKLHENVRGELLVFDR